MSFGDRPLPLVMQQTTTQPFGFSYLLGNVERDFDALRDCLSAGLLALGSKI